MRGRATPRDTDARLAWVIVVGTIPAGILGLALEHKLRDLFASPTSAAIFLTINGVLLLASSASAAGRRGPATARGTATSRISKMGFNQALGDRRPRRRRR